VTQRKGRFKTSSTSEAKGRGMQSRVVRGVQPQSGKMIVGRRLSGVHNARRPSEARPSDPLAAPMNEVQLTVGEKTSDL
jgi:hypothetical protein